MHLGGLLIGERADSPFYGDVILPSSCKLDKVKGINVTSDLVLKEN